MPDCERGFTGQDAGQLAVEFFDLLWRQVGPQLTISGGSPEAGKFGRVDGTASLTVVERGRPALFSSALRAFGFELRCAELPMAWRWNEVERSRVRIHAVWPVFDRHNSSACNARVTFRSAVPSS